MNPDELQSVLEDGELSPYQAKAFVALLKLGDASVSELVDACTVPQPRIYDVLRTLNEKGYIETYEDDALRARVIDPVELISELETKSGRYSAAAETIDDIWEQPTHGQHDVEIFTEFSQVIHHAIDGIERANDSVNVAATGSEFLDLRSALHAAKADGVIVNLSLALDPSFRTTIDDFESYFEETASEVRYRERFSPFLTLVDASESYFGVPRREHGYGMFVQDPALSTMLYGHFQDSLWERWDRVYTDRTETFPKKYTDIKNCVAEIMPHVAEEAPLVARVNGYETNTGFEARIEGRIVDIVPAPDADVRARDADQVSLIVESDSETYSIGGFGAILEDIRAVSIWIEVHDE